jgi:hypothetical protein
VLIKQETDGPEDFADVFDFDEAFGAVDADRSG